MSTAITEPSTDFQRKARRGLTVYFAVVVLLSALFEGIIILKPGIDGLLSPGSCGCRPGPRRWRLRLETGSICTAIVLHAA